MRLRTLLPGRPTAALATLLAAGGLVLAAPAQAAGGSIDTLTGWDGATAIQGFGVPDTATYGQVITVPAGESTLHSFTFELKVSSTVKFRGEVFAWDAANGRATGASLYESAPRSTTQSATFEQVTFDAGDVPVTAGQQYVLFASVSRDDGQPIAVNNTWGAVDGSPYAGGAFVYQGSGADESRWTTASWGSFTSYDLAFRAEFGTQQAVTGLAPSLSGLAKVGQVLTAHAGPVQPADSTLSYVWKADGVVIPAQSGSTLTLAKAQVGKHITVTITASHTGYAPQTATSDPTPYVRARVAEPRLTVDDATPRQGQSITVLAQGLQAGSTYTLVSRYLPNGGSVERVADQYGEIKLCLTIPYRAPLGYDTIGIWGYDPPTAASVIIDVRRGAAPV